jgi:hypothetical protein
MDRIRRYMGLDVLAKCRLRAVPTNPNTDTAEEVTMPAAITA